MKRLTLNIGDVLSIPYARNWLITDKSSFLETFCISLCLKRPIKRLTAWKVVVDFSRHVFHPVSAWQQELLAFRTTRAPIGYEHALQAKWGGTLGIKMTRVDHRLCRKTSFREEMISHEDGEHHQSHTVCIDGHARRYTMILGSIPPRRPTTACRYNRWAGRCCDVPTTTQTAV